MPEIDYTCAAIDLGASSGRVVVGKVGDGELGLTEVHRFPNAPVSRTSSLHWDVSRLYREILDGLRKAASYTPSSAGIDSWAVDYGLLDDCGRLLAEPRHHRDPRTRDSIEEVREHVSDQELYRVTGLQQLPINTLYQLVADRAELRLDDARKLLLIPDLFIHWLTGEVGAEITNVSTTQLYDVSTGDWAHDLMRTLDLPTHLLAPLREPGDQAGTLRADVAERTGLGSGFSVTTVASHDTASAVAAVPATREDFAYISCGTWSLVGLELDSPVLGEQSRAANITNERGIDGTTRYLRNTMGLWLLQECVRTWHQHGWTERLDALLDRAAREPAFTSVIDTDDPAFLTPQDMPAAIANACAHAGEPVPSTPAATVRCLLESLAMAHRRTLRDVARLADRHVGVVHLVGGGSRNALLCQLTADACGVPVIAGPTEATALGNILVQARAHGVLGERAELRKLVAETQPLRHFEPSGNERAWAAAESRLAGGRY
ncbi:rhamnulokinase [Haloactinomyces albus]|uniref:Rhamnulokinase n=1 Tax=Haloactinomyces albus TaxID=1352928 RepID=A0AAE3ZF00_9ACTN|nr:FGGY-family carbohydrate kinase [Haloactinomyces albus]MDR7303726.1 rhamnulokinase [Haloactinomyces albus]